MGAGISPTHHLDIQGSPTCLRLSVSTLSHTLTDNTVSRLSVQQVFIYDFIWLAVNSSVQWTGYILAC
jgi:hypothetical protein